MATHSNNLLVVLLGPTAVGKTELSIRLAKLLSCDIISSDSRQIYKTIDIGTAKPTEKERAMVRHHFVDILELDSYYSAAQYEQDVLKLIEEGRDASKEGMHNLVEMGIPSDMNFHLMAGGSMMYIDAVAKGIDDIPTITDETRELLRQRLQDEGIERLSRELKLLDPEYYEIVDKKNHKRIVHALEICYQTGKTYTSFRIGKAKERPFRILKIGLRRQRENLFSRINSRVDQMMADGLMDEARNIYHLRHLNSLNTVGYKELFNVISGEWEQPMAVERIKKNTRVYAKKQMTWFAKDDTINWIDIDDLTIDEQLSAALNLISNYTLS